MLSRHPILSMGTLESKEYATQQDLYKNRSDFAKKNQCDEALQRVTTDHGGLGRDPGGRRSARGFLLNFLLMNTN